MPEIRLNKVGPIVRKAYIGEGHIESDRLIVGDTDVVKSLWSLYGGGRQMIELFVEIHMLTSDTTEVSQSGNGVFAESSEP